MLVDSYMRFIEQVSVCVFVEKWEEEFVIDSCYKVDTYTLIITGYPTEYNTQYVDEILWFITHLFKMLAVASQPYL